MKRIAIFLATAATLCTATFASAQVAGGLMMDRDIVTPADVYELTQTSFTFPTARSMSMAGAFTSLGADPAAMSINPAGLGMYRRSELSITPMMSFQNAKNSARTPNFGRNNKSRFSLGNIGYVAQVYNGSGVLAGVTLGFGYNRVHDLNYRYSHYTVGNQWSIADVFSRLLQSENMDPNAMINRDGRVVWEDINPRFWGAAAGYANGMTNYVNGEWQPTWIGTAANVGHYTNVISSGSVGEYDLSMAFNIDNKFYIGATLGIQSLRQRIRYEYTEDYYYGENEVGIDPSLDYQLLESQFDQQIRLSGAGVNFKFGMIYRPIAGLRIGMAVHTPTRYWVDRYYKVENRTRSQVYNNSEGFSGVTNSGLLDLDVTSYELEDTGDFSWVFSSPTRLMFGLSYAFGTRGVISVDYQRDWYNGMRMRQNPAEDNNYYNDTFRDWFRAANIVRVGAEFKPLPFLSLRAGFGYMGSMLKEGSMIGSAPMAKELFYYSGGIGFLLTNNVTLDLAYSYSDTKYTDYDLFYFDAPNENITGSALYNTRMNRHTAAITLGLRF